MMNIIDQITPIIPEQFSHKTLPIILKNLCWHIMHRPNVTLALMKIFTL